MPRIIWFLSFEVLRVEATSNWEEGLLSIPLMMQLITLSVDDYCQN